MVRIPDKDRLGVIDAHIGHWQQADLQNGTPIEIVPGYGVAQLQADRDAYHAKQEQVAQLESDLQAAKAERDGFFGVGPDDGGGAWFRLKQYKEFVLARLGTRHPLSRTVPNLGRVVIERYVTILHRFIDHWERVDAQLTPPLTLGSYTLANLQTAHDDVLARVQTADQVEQAKLPLAREERDQMFGDEPGDERDETSIVARLILYHATINAMFPKQPLADSLPEIFPGQSPTSTLPTFRFNWVQIDASTVELWFEQPAGFTGGFTLFMRDGTTEFFTAVSVPPGQVWKTAWPDVVIMGEVDEVVLRDGQNLDVARGVRDTTLADPGA